ncbi:NCS2 family nucleobase:cation symporter [Actinotalea sp. M2MS4P-6]|uniref:uracil-xanthine permease family protein n=1 Tax=Actinotalea sp. M2MS4P-6 TaxID=2983762 RepID=UPI0021E39C2C|nr:solute carrier family 23 protein [Actinotalea sp. M2MS4P-6]MCV2393066.1 NCS2 family nucleobase:cation symporter [Actinotalea sp. M2MS4P-6]
MSGFGWQVHGTGRAVAPGAVVSPEERLSWPRTIGIGMQHVVAMFGATFLVPLITGMPPATTLFFSAIGTALFLLLTGNRLPSYLGSSFAFLAPIAAVAGTETGQVTPETLPIALGGILLTGVLLAVVGIVVQIAGYRWIEIVMPPVVTGAIVALIGFNLAPAAWNNVQASPTTALITLAAIILITVLFKGILGRLAILLGVLVGYVSAWAFGEVDFTAVSEAGWIGLPTFHAPQFSANVIGLFAPVVFVLIAENVGHVKSVAAMTGQDLDPKIGRALMADGIATTLAGLGGGSGTTTYAENIGVMAATRVYSTAAYWVAAGTALVLSLSPKFGAVVATIPAGVLGGAGTVLYGMIGVLGARIWVQNKVNFSDPVNLTTAAVALIVGIANFTWVVGDMRFEGIALGTAAAIGIYHVMRGVAKWRGTHDEPASPASVPGGAELSDV